MKTGNSTSLLQTPSLGKMGNTMSQVIKLAFALTMLGGCAEVGKPVNQVQTRLVDKSIFQGEWWMLSTTIDVDTDEAMVFGSAGAFAPWEGAQSESDLGIGPGTDANPTGGSNIARIRWVIDENTLFAYRAYELVSGGNDEGRDPDFRGQPLAAFRIQGHFDTRQQYNPVTGEFSNVTYEDSADRRWYDRQFMRVDWSQNLITSFYPNIEEYAELFAQMRPESVPFQIQENGAHSDFPATWQPQFIRIKDDASYRFRDEWPSSADSTVHYMSFVTQEVWSPGGNCLMFGGVCSSVNVTHRHAFLRVPPEHEYASETLNHAEYDKFGIIRQQGRTYVRGGRDRESLHQRCTADADCGVGGYCRMEGAATSGFCAGGLTYDQGETDFLTFFRERHNFYKKSFRRVGGRTVSCVADWECDGRYGDTTENIGSTCDKAAHVCTIPLRDRAGENGASIRQVAYHLNPHFPAHYARSSFQLFGSWNEVLMRGQRALTGRAAPTGPRISCQDQDPTQYCFCGTNATAAEVRASDRTCAWQYNPFLPPTRAAELGVTDPYQCYVRQPANRDVALLPHVGDVQNPDAYSDYTAEEFQYEFVGPECLLVLKANSCDKTPGAACEELGDLRYQFFNYVQNAEVPFLGVAQPLSDPQTGELLASPANMAGSGIESLGANYARSFELNRCRTPGADFATCERELSEDQVFGGEDIRGYFSRLGRTEYPVALAPTGEDGHGVDDPSRPGLPTAARDSILREMARIAPSVQRLQGSEGRALIFSDRMRQLQGTPIERQFVESIGDQGRDALAHQMTLPLADSSGAQVIPAISPMDRSVVDSISPMRGGFIGGVLAEQQRQQLLTGLNRCFAHEPRIFDSGYNRWWAEAFRGRSRDETALRFSQGFFRGVMLHEMGHAIGLEHNFAASLDRDQYNDGYYAIARDIPLPDPRDYDQPSLGGNGDGRTNGEESVRWKNGLKVAREQRMLRGIGNYMSSSIMEYPGDFSDLSGLGHYDSAAVTWNYFGLSENYRGNPVRPACTTNAECGAAGTCATGEGGVRYCQYRGTLVGLSHADRAERAYFTYYRGGDACRADTECPNSQARAGGQAVFQRCIRNPRYSPTPTACGGSDRDCVCSPFGEDLKDYQAGTPRTPWQRRTDIPPQFTASSFGFCSNSRTNDISWCSTFDAGESFREVVDHFRRRWQEGYPSAYFRNFRRATRLGGSSLTGIITTAKISQHLFFRYYYEPEFRSQTGPLGLDDQYLASVDTMNWLAELASLPDYGSYKLDSATQTYRFMGPTLGMSGSDISLGLGQGYYTWSQFQTGQNGFFRMERSGVYYDKYIALLALAIRDWGLRFTLDERFFVNFYDLFPLEMTELFGGFITNDTRAYGARIQGSGASASVKYTDLYRNGTCGVTASTISPCRGNQDVTYPEPAIEASNDVLRAWATILALAQFPVFYNTTFENQLSIYKLGNGDGWQIPARRADGSPACEFGNPSRVAGCENADPASMAYNFNRVDFIRYRSQRFNTTYLATVIRPRVTYNLEDEQLGFKLLRRLNSVQDRVQVLSALVSPTSAQTQELQTLQTELTRGESFLGYLIQIQRSYGVSSYIR